MILIDKEIEVLKMLAGEREPEWGAAVSVCLESLAGAGYCTNGPAYMITEAGTAALARAKQRREVA